MSLIALIIMLPLSFGHMSMQYPYPRDNNGAYAKWQANEPMITAHPQICHGLAADTTVREGNTFTAGDTISIDLYGSVPHNGGHCSFWYSTDDLTFTKIIDIKDCTLHPTTTAVTFPATMPTQCATKCTFAFSWVPVWSGGCEMYMGCADIKVNGALGGNPSPISVNFQTSFIDKSAAGYGCSRVDDTTHWTTIFGPLKTDYDETDVADDVNHVPPNDVHVPHNDIDVDITSTSTGDDVNVAVNDTDTETGTCYMDASLAINLDNDIDDGGTCGSGLDGYRCETGMCCSAAGHCGPVFDGTGWMNYDANGYYDTDNEAFAAYCSDAIGDWRVVSCEDGNVLYVASDVYDASGCCMVNVFLLRCILVIMFLFYI